MKKGGYKIIDFKGTALSGTAVELPGIYDQIVDDFDKAILVSGVSLNDDLQDDAYASVKGNDGSVELTVYGGIITVTEDDGVTFAVSKTPAELAAEIGNLDNLDTTDKESVVGAINELKRASDLTTVQASEFTVPEGWSINANETLGQYNENSYDIRLFLTSETGIAAASRFEFSNILPQSLAFNKTTHISVGGSSVISSNVDHIVSGFVNAKTITVDNFSGSVLKAILIHISGLR